MALSTRLSPKIRRSLHRGRLRPCRRIRRQIAQEQRRTRRRIRRIRHRVRLTADEQGWRVYRSVYRQTVRNKGVTIRQLAAWHHISPTLVRKRLLEREEWLRRKLSNQRFGVKDGKVWIINLEQRTQELWKPVVIPPGWETSYTQVIVEFDSHPQGEKPLYIQACRIVPDRDADILAAYKEIKMAIAYSFGRKVANAIDGYRKAPVGQFSQPYRRFKRKPKENWKPF